MKIDFGGRSVYDWTPEEFREILDRSKDSFTNDDEGEEIIHSWQLSFDSNKIGWESELFRSKEITLEEYLKLRNKALNEPRDH